jgi:transcriptional regulator with XRE-family HTH domain
MLDIGARLRSERQAQGLSLRDLAARAEVSASMLSQIENGKANPSVRSLYSITEALDVSFDYFFPGEGEELSPPETATGPDEEFTASDMRQLELSATEAEKTAPPPATTRVLHVGERPVINLKGGVQWERLTSAPEKNAEFLEVLYEPGASSGARMSHHIGREFGLVLEGELTVELGFEQHVLKAGDSIIFDSALPHRLSNTGDTWMRAVWVVMNASPQETLT